MKLEKELRKVSDGCGVDFFGIADLTPAHDAILKQGGAEIAAYPRAVSIGIALPNGIVDMLPRYREHDVIVSYRHFGYGVVNDRLDATAFRLSSAIEKHGFRALPVPAAKRSSNEKICAVFSNKLAAHLAGLGWIGKSCLLVTPGAGPRTRWTTVLTDAPLEAGSPMEERCGDCHQCVDICPKKAFTGQPFHPEEEREVRFDARKCEDFFKEMKADSGGGEAVCGLCLYVCPHGRKKQAPAEI